MQVLRELGLAGAVVLLRRSSRQRERVEDALQSMRMLGVQSTKRPNGATTCSVHVLGVHANWRRRDRL